MRSKRSESLLRAARRASQEPFFLASVLHSYQMANNLEDGVLAELLSCALDDLPRLALCRRPVASSSTFLAEIEHLAQRFELHGDQLAMMIRQVDALDSLRQHLGAFQATSRMLRAARDHDETTDPSPEDDNG